MREVIVLSETLKEAYEAVRDICSDSYYCRTKLARAKIEEDEIQLELCGIRYVFRTLANKEMYLKGYTGNVISLDTFKRVAKELMLVLELNSSMDELLQILREGLLNSTVEDK